MPALTPQQYSLLLDRVSVELRLGNHDFGKLFGVSPRTMSRWLNGGVGPGPGQWAQLARLVHPKNRALAVDIATALGQTLVSLGIEQPPPAGYAGKFGASSGGPPLGDLVDSVVCAAAEAIAASPQTVRPALLAALDRTASLGLSLDDVRAALRAVPARNPEPGPSPA